MIELLTAILVIITGFYAWVTFKMLKANENVLIEMKKQRDDLFRPYIDISIAMFPDNPIFYLKVVNSGKTAAKQLKLSLDKDFYKVGEQKEGNNIREYNIFKNTIDSLSPNTVILLMLAQGFVVFGENSSESITPKTFTVTATYEVNNNVVTEKTEIDLHPFLGCILPHDPIVSKLKDIKEVIEKK